MKEAWLAVALAADRWKPSVGAWRSGGQLMKGVCGECWAQKSDCHGLEAKFGGENSHWPQKFGYKKNK